MRTMKHWALAAAAAAALALAGCGGGGSSSSGGSSGTTSDPAPKTALSYATDLNNSVDDLMTLAGAVDEAGSALMMAKKYADMLGTLKSDGNSATEMMNAAMVLKAKSDLEAAIMTAKTARTMAQTAKDGLPDDADPSVATELDDAIKAANDQITAAEKILGGDDLTMYVEMVTGDDEDDVQTPADKGEAVAMAVAMALGPTVPEGGSSTANGASLRVTHVATTPTLTGIAKANRYQAASHDPKSMTWAMLVGEDNVEMMPLGTISGTTFTTGNAELPASSIADMVLISTATATATGNENDGVNYAASYKGIPGTAICLGTDCKVEAVANVGTSGQDGFVDNTGNRKFSGSWYFTPHDAMAIWKKGTDNASTVGVDESQRYVVDDMIATYGHWLVVSTDAATLGQVTVNTYAYTGANTTGLAFNVDQSNDDLSSDSATYNGSAAGRSVHKTFDPDGKMTDIQSGRFMASVVLTAKFGENPMLGGTVSGFTSPDNPDAVDSDWTVTLKDTGIETDGTLANSNVGVTDASGQDGTWSAHAYGTSGERPTGVFGGFNAHFTDGHVAGAYATRK